jgi:hypothetical protein
MAQFERPADTVTDAAQLNVGDQLWKVYGIWPPQFSGPYTLANKPVPHSAHARYSDIHSGSAEKIVFGVRTVEGYLDFNFASDGNLTPGHSHNDNYWVRSEAAALAAVARLREQWEARPELIVLEQARREAWRREEAYID